MKSYIFLSAFFAFTNSVYSSFNVSNLMNAIPSNVGMISAQFNNSLYMFGGKNFTVTYSNELYKLTLTDNTFNWEAVPQTNAPAGTIYGQGYVTSDNQNMVVMGGVTEANNNSTLNLQIYTYNFASQTWTANPSNSAVVDSNDASILFNRKSFSANYDPKTQQTYVFGGTLSDGIPIYSDFRVLDASFKVTNLNAPNFGRYGHTASLTSDGKIVVLGGIYPNPVNGNVHAGMQTASVYSIDSNTWTTVNNSAASGNVYPSSRLGHTAVINSDDQIIIFGGDSGSSQSNRQYLNDIAILDTKTWTWTIPTISGIPPSNRTGAAGALLDEKTFVVAFGKADDYCDDINVYDFSTSSWIPNFNESSSNGSNDESPSHSSSGVSKGLIAGVTVAGVVVVLIIAFLLWKFKFCSGDRSWVLKDRAS